MEFVFFAVIGIVAAATLAMTLVLWGQRKVPVVSPKRRAFLWRCGVTPFLGLLWILFSFVVYSYAVGLLFYRDNRLSTNPHTPLPDSYIIGSVDYHNGYIIRPHTTMDGFPHDSPDCVAEVLELQIADPYLLGSKFIWPSSTKEFFLLDPWSGAITKFGSFDEVKAAAAARGIETNFNEFGGYSLMESYVRYRPIWFDWFFPVFSVLGLCWAFGSLVAQGRRIQRESRVAAEEIENAEPQR